MDKIPDYIIKSIKDFINELEINDIKIDNAFLFGSYANGNSNEYSDIDLAIISNSFSGNRFLDKEIIRKYIVRINTDISPLPFRPEDFTDNDFFAEEILRTGIKII